MLLCGPRIGRDIQGAQPPAAVDLNEMIAHRVSSRQKQAQQYDWAKQR